MKGRCPMLELPQIPKCCRQPRSRRARPPSPKGSSSEFSSYKDCSSGTTTTSMDQGSDEPIFVGGEETPEFSLFKHSLSLNGSDKGFIQKSIEAPVTEVKSITEVSSMDSCKRRPLSANGNDDPHSSDRASTHSSAEPLLISSDKPLFPAVENVDAWLAPGNVVWAKTAYNVWWPAEVIDDRTVSRCSGYQHFGPVLVRLYGKHEHAWLDPVRDLSQFDHCFEERKKTPLKAFQDALKQALCKNVRTNPRALSERCSGETRQSNQHVTSDSSNTSSSNETKDCPEEGRGKRKRKMKIHFDELTFPEKPLRRMRRLRIMRSLGLIAPAGSPFSLSHARSAQQG